MFEVFLSPFLVLQRTLNRECCLFCARKLKKPSPLVKPLFFLFFSPIFVFAPLSQTKGFFPAGLCWSPPQHGLPISSFSFFNSSSFPLLFLNREFRPQWRCTRNFLPPHARKAWSPSREVSNDELCPPSSLKRPSLFKFFPRTGPTMAGFVCSTQISRIFPLVRLCRMVSVRSVFFPLCSGFFFSVLCPVSALEWYDKPLFFLIERFSLPFFAPIFFPPPRKFRSWRFPPCTIQGPSGIRKLTHPPSYLNWLQCSLLVGVFPLGMRPMNSSLFLFPFQLMRCSFFFFNCDFLFLRRIHSDLPLSPLDLQRFPFPYRNSLLPSFLPLQPFFFSAAFLWFPSFRLSS